MWSFNTQNVKLALHTNPALDNIPAVRLIARRTAKTTRIMFGE